jgi:PAS domain S-box-containing protein
LEDIQEGYYEADLAGVMLAVNDAFCKAIGYAREEILGQPFTKFTDPRSARRLWRAFNEVYTSGQAASQLEHRFTRRDGTSIFGELTVSLMRDESGAVSGFRGLAHDVTPRYEVEEALRRSEEKYRTLLEDIREGYYEMDLRGNILEVNDTVLEMVPRLPTRSLPPCSEYKRAEGRSKILSTRSAPLGARP